MNYFDLVRLKKQIESQKLNVARAKEKGTSITIELDDMPKGGSSSNKIESSVEQAEIDGFHHQHGRFWNWLLFPYTAQGSADRCHQT